jgi:hypothetical protein
LVLASGVMFVRAKFTKKYNDREVIEEKRKKKELLLVTFPGNGNHSFQNVNHHYQKEVIISEKNTN